MFSALKKLLTLVIEFVYPQFCCNCQKLGEYMCDECFEYLTFFPLPIKLHLPVQHLDLLLSAVQYEEPIISLLHSLKYQSVQGIGKFCGQLLFDTVNIPDVNIVTAVPLHKERQQERGFNQSEEIGKELARLLQLPYVPLLKKKKTTANQASLTQKDKRIKNLENIFALYPRPQPKIDEIAMQYPRVLLVDDVTTTGTTLNECAKVLKAAGFQQVIGLTVAHGS